MPSPTELYKDKIEVSLDGRQIFYLFFGGAVIVGLVFVLGVMVGRRVEARGHVEHARTQAATDPLAALDRLEGSAGLSFQDKLSATGGSAAPTEVEKQIASIEKAKREADPVAAKKADELAAKVEKEKADKAEKATLDAEKKLAAEKARAEKDEKAKLAADKEKEKEKAKADKAVAAAAEDKPADKTRYTLQLSSFHDRAEAEAFLAAVKSSGYQPNLTEAKVDGKTYYRVRLGTYKSVENANNAKADYEKSSRGVAALSKTASIMKL